MNAKEFFAKAKGTKLEKEIVILFNLYCVYKDIRPAYLHYSRSKEISTKSQTEVIKKLFPFFKSVERRANLIIFHIKKLPPYDTNAINEHHNWLGKVLGYSCPGQLGTLNPVVYIFSFKMTSWALEYNIYTEICWDETSFDYSKVEKFKGVVKELSCYQFTFEKTVKDWFNKLHTVSLKKEYFYQIGRRKKKVELRLYDEKRKQIEKGDIIEFKCGQESFRKLVKDVKVFDTFLQALKSCTLKKTLPGINTYAEGVEIYHSISNYKENEKKYGVCAIILDNI